MQHTPLLSRGRQESGIDAQYRRVVGTERTPMISPSASSGRAAPLGLSSPSGVGSGYESWTHSSANSNGTVNNAILQLSSPPTAAATNGVVRPLAELRSSHSFSRAPTLEMDGVFGASPMRSRYSSMAVRRDPYGPLESGTPKHQPTQNGSGNGSAVDLSSKPTDPHPPVRRGSDSAGRSDPSDPPSPVRRASLDAMVSLSERRIPTFTNSSSTADLMQTIIVLREMNNKLQLSVSMEQAAHEKELRQTVEHLELAHKKATMELDVANDRLRSELASYQKTSSDLLQLLSTLRAENEELVTKAEEEKRRLVDADAERQHTAAMKRQESALNENGLRSEVHRLQESLQRSREEHADEIRNLTHQLQQLQAERARDWATAQEQLRSLTAEHALALEAVRREHSATAALAAEREAELGRQLSRLEEERDALLLCVDDALDTAEGLLVRTGSTRPSN